MKAGFFLFWFWMVRHKAAPQISSIRYKDISDDKVALKDTVDESSPWAC
jgi:hypothetical protein